MFTRHLFFFLNVPHSPKIYKTPPEWGALSYPSLSSWKLPQVYRHTSRQARKARDRGWWEGGSMGGTDQMFLE